LIAEERCWTNLMPWKRRNKSDLAAKSCCAFLFLVVAAAALITALQNGLSVPPFILVVLGFA
jgi:hypothetical protein